MELARIAAAILATWRITALLYWDNGPWYIFLRLREWATAMQHILDDERAILTVPRHPFWHDLFGCFWCLSLWVGILLTPLAIWCWWVLIPFALSGAAILLSGGGRIIWRTMAEK